MRPTAVTERSFRSPGRSGGRIAVILLVTAVLASTVVALGRAQAPASPIRVVGYYADWTAGRYPLAGIPAAKLTHVNYADEMVRSLDWVSVMTYDFHSGSQTRAGYNAALFNNSDPANPKLNVHDAVDALLAKGVPPDRLVVGVPFFGRGWTGVTSSAVWSTATKTAQAGAYATIVERYLNAPGYTRHWDDVAKVPSLHNAGTGHWISYDDPESVRLKAEYVARRKLGGVMFWELSQDRGPLLDALRAGLGL